MLQLHGLDFIDGTQIVRAVIDYKGGYYPILVTNKYEKGASQQQITKQLYARINEAAKKKAREIDEEGS